MSFIDQYLNRFDKKTKTAIFGISLVVVVLAVYFAFTYLTYYPISPEVIPDYPDIIAMTGKDPLSSLSSHDQVLTVIFDGKWEAQISTRGPETYNIYTGIGHGGIAIKGPHSYVGVRVWKREDNAHTMYCNVKQAGKYGPRLDEGECSASNCKVDMDIFPNKNSKSSKY